MNDLKIPPHSIDAEQGVLGSVLIDKNAMNYAAEQIEPKHFYLASHAEIFKTMRMLHASKKPIDLITLSDAMQEPDAIAIVGDLMRNTPSSASLKTYCNIVKQRWKGRELIAAGNKLAQSIYDGHDYDKAREDAYRDLEALLAGGGEEVISDGLELSGAFVDEMERLMKAGGITGWSTGDRHIDNATGGLQPGDYVGLAARSGGGKTTKALNIAKHFIDEGRRVLIFSMEMKKQRAMMKIVSDHASVEFNKIKSANLDDPDWFRVSQSLEVIKSSKLHIDDSSGLSISDIERKAKQLKAKYGHLELIVLDYVQRIKIDSGSMYSELTNASNRLKDLFMELGCAGIVLAQLKKNSMGMPNASDLRETGAIENDSDLLIFLHTDSEDRKPHPNMFTCEILNKVRYGETGVKMLKNELKYQRFTCVDGEYEPPEEKKSYR